MESQENLIVANGGKPVVFRPSLFIKRMTARRTFTMGVEFVSAGMFLRRQNQKSSASLHLLCQGMELILKSLLLDKDYDNFKKKIRSQRDQHDLYSLAEMVEAEYHYKKVRPRLKAQLKELSDLYRRNRLRYPNTLFSFGYHLWLDTDLVFWKLVAVARLARRTIFASDDNGRQI